MTIGSLLKKFREMAGFSVEDMSHELMIEPAVLKNIEQGFTLPDNDALILYCNFLKIQPEWLLKKHFEQYVDKVMKRYPSISVVGKFRVDYVNYDQASQDSYWEGQ